jgi:hypothetical protein
VATVNEFALIDGMESLVCLINSVVPWAASAAQDRAAFHGTCVAGNRSFLHARVAQGGMAAWLVFASATVRD